LTIKPDELRYAIPASNAFAIDVKRARTKGPRSIVNDDKVARGNFWQSGIAEQDRSATRFANPVGRAAPP